MLPPAVPQNVALRLGRAVTHTILHLPIPCLRILNIFSNLETMSMKLAQRLLNRSQWIIGLDMSLPKNTLTVPNCFWCLKCRGVS